MAIITGTSGNDPLNGTSSADTISGLAGNDTLSGFGGNDSLDGGDGNDFLDGLRGVDTLLGGTGDDYYVVDVVSNGGGGYQMEDVVLESLGQGSDTLEVVVDPFVVSLSSYFTVVLMANVENLLLYEEPGGPSAVSWLLNGTGNALANQIAGNAAANVLDGGAGDDVIEGWGGNDTLDGGAGVDTAVYNGARAGYTVTSTASGYTVSGSEGTDTLSNIESAQFSDMTLALDAGEAAGNTLIVETSGEILSFARAVSATNPIVGGWYATGPSSPGEAGGTVVITFLADGTFLFAQDGDSIADPTGQDGMERGTYTWDSSTGAFTSITTVDTNGDWGFSHPQGSINVQVNGDTLAATSSEGPFSFTRVADAANPIVGGWNFTGDANDRVALTFFADGTYMLAEDKVIAEPGGQDGMERGTYTWNASTGAFTSITSVDTNGEWGLSHSFINRVTVTTSGTGDPILGTGGDDTLAGGSDNDFIFGGGGDDTLIGGDGDDVLDGGTGADSLEGGNGNDLYFVDDPNDQVVETSNSPPLLTAGLPPTLELAGVLDGFIDTVIAAISYSLSPENLQYVENVTLAGAATTVTGNELDNVLTGNELINTVTGGPGNDTLEGGAGADTAVFSGESAAYTISGAAPQFAVAGPEGNDTLTNIERLQFSDKSLAFDMTVGEAGGKTALLMGACLGASGLSNKAVAGALLGYFDGGYTLTDAATALVDAGIVAQLAGGADNQHFVDWMCVNLVDALPDAATEAVLIEFITSGQFTQATFLATLAAHQINQDHIGLVGLQGNGMEFV